MRIDKVMRNSLKLGGGRLGHADVKFTIALARIGGDDAGL
jgi:hypothetical protein